MEGNTEIQEPQGSQQQNLKPEVKGFEIKKTVEQTPLRDEVAKSFFNKWCEINDSIVPQIASRQYWEQHVKDQGILSKKPDGTSTLFIPNDIHLWEMLGVTEAIDRDIFAKKPEVWREKKEKIQDLGKMFRNSGIYLAQRVSSLQQGRSIAEGLAQEFFAYGNALSTGQMDLEQKEIPIEKIALNPISPEETEQVDKWLSGDKLYSSRMSRVEKEIDQALSTEVDQIIENTRQATLNQFFRIAEKAFTLSAETNTNPLIDYSKPWSTSGPIHSAFLRNIERKMEEVIETPKTELQSSIFSRGAEKLLTEMEGPATHRLVDTIRQMFGNPETRKLINILKVEQLKKDLQEVRRQGDINKISRTEIEIAKKIHEAVARFPYREFGNNPSEIIKNKELNCLGATILVGRLFKEVGINHLQVYIPEHAVVLLTTADGRAFWQDSTEPFLFKELQNMDLQGEAKDGKTITVSDIVSLSNKPTPEGLLITKLKPGALSWIKEDHRVYIEILEPEIGQQAGLLSNISGFLWEDGITAESIEALKLRSKLTPNSPNAYPILADKLYRTGKYQEAVDYFKKALAILPNESSLYDRLGNAFRRLERYHEAIKTYEQAIGINPKDEEAYNGLGNTFFFMDRDQEAFEMYQKAISINPESAHPYNGSANILMEKGDYKGAIEDYERFISLADKKDDSSLIERAEEQIKECQSKLLEK